MEKNLISLESGQETEWLSLRQANKVGIIVAALLILGGISLLFEEPTPQTFEMTVLKTPPKVEQWGKVRQKVEYEKVKIPVNPTDAKFSSGINVGLPLGVGICLLFRSFLPGLTFVRVVLTVLGGFIMGLSIAVVVFGIISYGFPNIGVLLGNLLIMGVGLILLKYGFRPKVFKWLG